MRVSEWLLLVSVAAFADRATAEPLPRVVKAEPAVDWNERFNGREGWIGGDGVYSVSLADDRVLFFFGDSLIGKVSNGRRNAQMVNNSVGLFSATHSHNGIRFVSGPTKDGKPSAIIKPAEGTGWFWPHAGVIVGSRLHLFLAHIDKAGSDGPFGFKQIGEFLATVENPLDDPIDWRIEQRRLPFAEFAERRETIWGAAVLVDGDWLYVYGITDRRKQLGSKRLIVARTPLDKPHEFGAWRFQQGNKWVATPTVEGTISGLANEFSVNRLPDGKGYVLIYSDGGLSERILGRFAESPAGPWSESVLLYRCPEGGDNGLFCYAAKAQAWATRANELLISYCTNAWDFNRLFADIRVYRPRFVRVSLEQ